MALRNVGLLFGPLLLATGHGLQQGIPMDCSMWYDGCNDCTVQESVVYECTERQCLRSGHPYCKAFVTSPQDLKASPAVVAEQIPSSQDVTVNHAANHTMPEPPTWKELKGCKLYFDGCNECFVEDGRLDLCMEMWCDVWEKPYCMEYEDSPAVRKPRLSPKDVTFNDTANDTKPDWPPTWKELKGCKLWFDGCNDCTVEDGRLELCMEMWCDVWEKPYCMEYEDTVANVVVDQKNMVDAKPWSPSIIWEPNSLGVALLAALFITVAVGAFSIVRARHRSHNQEARKLWEAGPSSEIELPAV